MSKAPFLHDHDLSRLATLAHAKCQREQWKRDWQHGGVYLHLEVSEFIESLRGKGGNPVNEAADVLFVLLSVCRANDVSLVDVEERLRALVNS